MLDATIVRITHQVEDAPSSHHVHLQFHCCGVVYWYRVSNLRKRLADAKNGKREDPHLCRACRLGRKRKEVIARKQVGRDSLPDEPADLNYTKRPEWKYTGEPIPCYYRDAR